jgi:hypothetical protein
MSRLEPTRPAAPTYRGRLGVFIRFG